VITEKMRLKGPNINGFHCDIIKLRRKYLRENCDGKMKNWEEID